MANMRTAGLQFTDLQYDWMRREAERLDRTIPWIVRKLVDEAMAKQAAGADRQRPVLDRRPAA